MIKRLFPMILTVLILCTTAYAAEPELPEGVTVTDITEHTASAEYVPPQYYPTDIQTKTEDGVKLLLKTFEVGADVSPSALIEANLTQNGVEYDLRDILRNTLPDEQERKTVSQPFVTLDKAEDVPPDPPEPPDPPDEPENPNTHTEVTTETTTRTEVRSSTTYEYSDAIGQITIAKRDNEGKSLDGAIFNIQIEFANGQKGGDSAFEVYNGSRLFTYTHPRDDHDPAKVTVTEVRAPDGYIADPTTKTAIVHPTYTPPGHIQSRQYVSCPAGG